MQAGAMKAWLTAICVLLCAIGLFMALAIVPPFTVLNRLVLAEVIQQRSATAVIVVKRAGREFARHHLDALIGKEPIGHILHRQLIRLGR